MDLTDALLNLPLPAFVPEHTGALLLVALGITTAVAHSLHGAIPLLRKWAAHRADKRVDDAITWLDHAIDWVTAGCDVLARLLPHVTLGPRPKTQPIARTLAPPPLPPPLPPPPAGL